MYRKEKKIVRTIYRVQQYMMRSFRRVRSKQVRGITRNVFRTKELKIANRRLMHTPWCMKKLGKSFYKRRFQPFLTENKQTNETPNPYMS